MRIKNLFVPIFVVSMFALAQTKIKTETQTTITTETQTKVAVVHEEQRRPMVHRRVALVVQDHADRNIVKDIPKLALSDALAAKLSGRGLQVINPYNAYGVNQNRSVAGEALPRTSVIELSRRLGAEGIVTASVIEFYDNPIGSAQRPFGHQYSIRISFNLADVGTGATICGENMKVLSPKYTNEQVMLRRQEYIGELIYAAAEKCADKLVEAVIAQNWQPTPPPPKKQKPRPAPQVPLPEGTILDHKIDALVHKMLSNPQFIRNYEESKARQNMRLPIVVLGGIENKTGNPLFNVHLEAASERFRVRLFNTKLFEPKDDSILVALAKRITNSGNSPLENGEIMSALKQHGSPDFFVAGDLKLLTDLDGISYFKLRLAIHSLLTGKIIWEEIETFNLKI